MEWNKAREEFGTTAAGEGWGTLGTWDVVQQTELWFCAPVPQTKEKAQKENNPFVHSFPMLIINKPSD